MALIAGGLGFAAPTGAAVWEVTLCTDTVPGGAPGELRRAITDANFGDVIRLPACVITLSGSAGDEANQAGDLDVVCPRTLFIRGAGRGRTILDGGRVDRVLDIHSCPFGVVSVSDVTIRGGQPPLGGGGGVRVRGVSFELLDSEVIENETTDDEGGGGGIAASLSGVITIRRSTIARNKALGTGGGLWVSNSVAITIADSTVAANEADFGGGLLVSSATLLLEQATVSGNRAAGSNGGGGLFITSGGSIASTLLWSTVTNNVAIGGSGGGMVTTGPVAVASSILADNQPEDCTGFGLISAGHNIQGDGSCSLGAVTDTVVPPLLGPLADNGGPTHTHALLPGSPAVDQGGDSPCPKADQRGVPRPQGASCDIGPVERQAPTSDRSAAPSKAVDPR